MMEDATEYSYTIKIPHERVAVLIGTDGSVKKDIEGATRSRIRVDSSGGDVFITGKNPVGLFSAREIIKAIGRGFNPEVAMLLLRQDYCFELINIDQYAGRSKKKMARLKGRVIGEDGKSRKTLENLTQTNISVYGRTVGIIGHHPNAELARKATEALLSGSRHATVYRMLEKKAKELKMEAIGEELSEERTRENTGEEENGKEAEKRGE